MSLLMYVTLFLPQKAFFGEYKYIFNFARFISRVGCQNSQIMF